MLSEPEIIAYLEGNLSVAERTRVEMLLAQNPELAREISEHQQMDGALAALLGDSAANEQVKKSILAVVRGASVEKIKANVLAETAHEIPATRGWLEKFFAPFNRPVIWGGGLAFASILFAVIFFSLPRAEEPAQLTELNGKVELIRNKTTSPATIGSDWKPGETLRTGEESSAKLRLSDGTIFILGSETELVWSKTSSRRDGKRLQLASGTLHAKVAKQRAPMVIETPHARAIVLGTEFDLNLGTEETRLGVESGRVKLQPNQAPPKNAREVKAGEAAISSTSEVVPDETTRRDPRTWPFSLYSPWNRSIGRRAIYEPVRTTDLDFTQPFQRVLKERKIIFADSNAARIPVRVEGKGKFSVPLPASVQISENRETPLLVVDAAQNVGYELYGVQKMPRGLIATEALRYDLRRLGINPDWRDADATRSAFAMGGLIRRGELTNGIRHALSIAVKWTALNRGTPDGALFGWPEGLPKNIEPLGKSEQSNLRIGALLAIPASINLAELGVGDSGAAFEIARALQDYGAYVTWGTSDDLNLFAEENIFTNSADADAILAKLLPHVRVVSNNFLRSMGGGGLPRRSAPPPFLEQP